MLKAWQERRFGPVAVRLDYLLVCVGVALAARPKLGFSLFVVIAVHELAHGLAAARLLAQPFKLVLQVGGAVPYLAGRSFGRRETAVLLAGPASGLLSFGLGLGLTRAGSALAPFGADLAYAAVLWNVFMLLPFPPLDGGLLLRQALLRRMSATWAWRSGWIAGLVLVAAIISLELSLLEPLVWLSGMSVVLGRSEAGYVRHLDAYAAWENGDHKTVIARVKAVPEYLDKRDRIVLLELGVSSALELQDQAAMQDFASQLPPQHPAAIRAAESLLRKDDAAGAKLAEHAYDALDAERVKRSEIDADRWADMMLHHAIFEARAHRFESALGLLERAVGLGYSHKDRLEAEPCFGPLASHPRWQALLTRMI